MLRLRKRKLAAIEKSFLWAIYLIVLFLILVFALAPIGSVAIAGAIANSQRCRVDEGPVHPETLYTLGVLGWLMLITLPAGALAGCSGWWFSSFIARNGAGV